MALARVAPPSTVVRTPFKIFWKDWLSWLAARISRHCTSGRPASIMTENWRKKIAISLVPTLPEPKVGMENSLLFSRIAPGEIPPRRNACAKACLLAAIRSPEIFCPDASLPENVKTGMFSVSLLKYLFGENRAHTMFTVRTLPNAWQRREPKSFPPRSAGLQDWPRD